MAVYLAKTKIKGYHGTYPENVESIKTNNFRESVNDDWYGDAVYFFIEGIAAEPPAELAKQYAIDASWDKKNQCYKYTRYSVLEAEIRVDNDKELDLTVAEGLTLLNQWRAELLKKLTAGGIKIEEKHRPTDVQLLNNMRQELGIEFVKAYVYIKFGAQRINMLGSKIPNVIIFAVNNPTKNISKPSIREAMKGEIL